MVSVPGRRDHILGQAAGIRLLATAGPPPPLPEARPAPPAPSLFRLKTQQPSQLTPLSLATASLDFPCRSTLFISFAVTVTGLSFLIVFH